MLFTISFKLKQHTPLIHFQADARDATIRATELKPKLDRFITGKLGDFDDCKHLLAGYTPQKESELRKRWKDDNEKFRTLDYSLRIDAKNVTREKIVGSKDPNFTRREHAIPPFFANLGDDYADAPKFLVWATTSLSFTSLHDELLELIPQYLDEFLWHQNFGTRQSKGLGSFTVDTADFEFKRYVPQGFFQFSIPNSDWKKCFETINDFYRLLRSGLNGVKIITERHGQERIKKTERTHYCKPIIFEYASFKRTENARSLLFQWEKKTVKQYFLDDRRKRQIKDHNLVSYVDGKPNFINDHPLTVQKSEQKVIKDLMGFSTTEQWGSYGMTLNKTHVPNENEDTIRRMKSPMFIKPVKEGEGYLVYFMFEPIPKEIKDAKIRFSFDGNSHDIHVLNPPNNFFEDMIRFAAKDIDWNHFFQVNTNYGPRAQAEGQAMKDKIVRIFTDIKKNLP